ncbi:hypothetical protein [Methanimicrococcus blatticola]|uniref:hypothetical protein n=1 Tax=Methanimicrococcus blatticola TaxID=91560 RepID=UPI00106143FC|nr:hypothetical protein [Methanimicrococcus blatticola]MBZ3935939.1 hypothetical protein [Methanimicrococcus blatticola]MCC2509448.1 hypothetical protein [Methanimicrococcus blatticola]
MRIRTQSIQQKQKTVLQSNFVACEAFLRASALFYHIRSLTRTYRCYLADTVSRCYLADAVSRYCLAGPVQFLPVIARKMHRF